MKGQSDIASEKADLKSDSGSDQQSLSTAPTTPNLDEQSLDDGNTELLEKGFIQLNTHDVSLIDQHIRVEKFARDLQSGVDALWSSRNYPRYKEVRVLLMRWQEDNLGVEEELLRLKYVFSHLYRYDVQCFEIPNKSPARVTISKVSSLIADCGVDSLVIIYYGGHAALSQQRNGPAVWAATNHPESVKFSSFGVQQILEEAASDVLLLYDCCYASHPAVNSAGQGVTEVIAACGFESQAPAVGPHSFTNALIQELEESFDGAPFYAAELHTRVLGSLKNWKPKLLRDSNGNVWTDENGRPKYECHKRRTPVHCLLTTERLNRSIMLAPLRSSNALEDETESKAPPGKIQLNVSDPTTYSKGFEQISGYPEVLISVRLEEDYLADDADEEDEKRQHPWREWFRNIPNAAKNVTIHGVYRSFSTLLVMSMPISLWNILPAHPAYSFIGFVKSGNLAPKIQHQPEKVIETERVESFTSAKVSEQETPSPDPQPEEGPPLLSAEKSDKPLKFLDPNGHKFLFPFWMCQTWEGMKKLIHEALAMEKELLPLVDEGQYRLYDINETVILPSLWMTFIRPGMSITMRIWPPSRPLASSISHPPHLPSPVYPCPTCARNPNDIHTYTPYAPPHTSYYPSYANPFWPPAPHELRRSTSRESIDRMGFPKHPTNPASDPFDTRDRARESIRHPSNTKARMCAGNDTESDSEAWSDPETYKRQPERRWHVEKGASKVPRRPKLNVERENRGNPRF
ncbi:hypothetical protein BKA61DRAFT_596219 [Leptodontidium sp. MPI-SDFR-AT-0119]|nr:hypothetical protein BKA61DRAFT_596219 [Leptodontidium sp. MPI-SDFR-AT-0119]